MSEAEDWAVPQSDDYAAPQDGVERLLGRLRRAEERLEALERGSPLRQAGMAAAQEGVTFDRDVTIDGDLVVSSTAEITGVTTIGGSTTIAGSLDVDAATTIGGDLDVSGLLRILSSAIVSGHIRSTNFVAGNSGWRLTATGLEVNTLTAKDAIIGDQALVSPLKIVAAAPNTASGWGVSTGHAAKASSTITVPPGFSQCVVVAWANMHFMDSSPNGGWVRATISGNSGAEMGGLANLQLGQSASHTHGLTGLTGGSVIGVSCDVRASVATAGMSGNIAQITAVGFFQR